jgi:hypothetical protein
MDLAPIVLFVYNRPQHTRKTLEALASNKVADRSVLYIYSDGPKENASSEIVSNINEVRKVIHEKNWCGKVYIIESGLNKGLVSSIIEGVTEIVNKHGRVIVLEDDLITSPFFLTYMNDALQAYRDFSNVYSVNAYMFPVETDKTESVLLPYTSSWGWGTWKDKWSCFDIKSSTRASVAENSFLRQRFNLANYDYITMLMNAKHSWGIHWYFSVFERNGLGVFPTQSLVENMGFDGSGVNCDINSFKQSLFAGKIEIFNNGKMDMMFYSKYLDYFSKNEGNKRSILLKFIKSIKKK